MPVRDSYTFTPAYNIVEVSLSGGKSRRRRDFLGGVHVITPTWILDGPNYTRFMNFFEGHIDSGALQFECDLLSNVGFVMSHLCYLSGGMPKLIQQSGDAYFVSAVLEVTPNPTKAYSIQFDVAAGPVYRVIDNGTFDLVGDISEFPPPRAVRLVHTRQTRGTWGGVYVNLDGIYNVLAHTASNILTLNNAPSVNTDWTVLAGLTPAATNIGTGAMILVPA